MNKVAYLECSHHEYVHVADAFICNGEMLVQGFTEETFFTPELWSYLDTDLECGVYHKNDVDISLLYNNMIEREVVM